MEILLYLAVALLLILGVAFVAGKLLRRADAGRWDVPTPVERCGSCDNPLGVDRISLGTGKQFCSLACMPTVMRARRLP